MQETSKLARIFQSEKEAIKGDRIQVYKVKGFAEEWKKKSVYCLFQYNKVRESNDSIRKN